MARRRQRLYQVASVGKLRWLWQLRICLLSVIKDWELGSLRLLGNSLSELSLLAPRTLRWL